MYLVKFLLCLGIMEIMVFMMVQYNHRNYRSGFMDAVQYKKVNEALSIMAIMMPFLIAITIPS